MSTSTHTITYRKTKSGEWVAYGPLAAFKGETMTPEGLDTYTLDEVVVTKRSGETKVERIARLGRPFDVDGVQMVYGYIAPSARRRSARVRSYHQEQDHEDCLSFHGGCGPSCPYNFTGR